MCEQTGLTGFTQFLMLLGRPIYLADAGFIAIYVRIFFNAFRTMGILNYWSMYYVSSEIQFSHFIHQKVCFPANANVRLADDFAGGYTHMTTKNLLRGDSTFLRRNNFWNRENVMIWMQLFAPRNHYVMLNQNCSRGVMIWRLSATTPIWWISITTIWPATRTKSSSTSFSWWTSLHLICASLRTTCFSIPRVRATFYRWTSNWKFRNIFLILSYFAHHQFKIHENSVPGRSPVCCNRRGCYGRGLLVRSWYEQSFLIASKLDDCWRFQYVFQESILF